MGPVAREAVPALIEALKDDDWEVRHMVIDALGKIGPGAQEALGELARILDDEKEIPALRASARKATENILKE
jgi:HEAT repeat protein